MLIIPAVDIKDGKCIRLTRGKADTSVIYNDNPVDAALHWQKEGASYLHVVDLDGAFTGKTVNFNLIKKLISAVKIPVEIGGGIRKINDIEKYIKAGADRIILGTQAVLDLIFLKNTVKLFGAKIAVGLDASKGKIAIQGWTKKTTVSQLDFALRTKESGVKTIIYTDISKDGMLKGPNLKSILKFVSKIGPDIIVSGGISTIEDVRRIKNLESSGVTGMIIGKALYAGNLSYKDAVKAEANGLDK